jgi:hypothetical protein
MEGAVAAIAVAVTKMELNKTARMRLWRMEMYPQFV